MHPSNIEKHLAGERPVETYLDTAADEEIKIPFDETVPAGAIPLLGEVNCTEHSFYESGYRPTKITGFDRWEDSLCAHFESEEENLPPPGSRAIILAKVDDEGSPRICNPETAECFVLLTGQERRKIGREISAWLKQHGGQQS